MLGVALLLPALLRVAAPFARADDSAISRENALKAAALYNLIPFIDWPSAGFPSPDSPVIIGVLGRDPFGRLLDGLVENERYHGHPIRVVRFSTAESVGLCHVLFIARAAGPQNWPRATIDFEHRPILTVSDVDDFASHGGSIQFFIARNHLRMIINLMAVRSAGLSVSSKLLRLAEVIPENASR
ncbi:YfiR family protein [Horticoccus luteus]|uniref:YfiR family protein n=1 Tax=Horticoccus luteus TaxID=2862869 RepID=A0A8F9TTB0_9BACT|nr:YfiR family protein [Horticoccus luteus]QYM77908.1 YfiR family protein [Horticoccus luteus]